VKEVTQKRYVQKLVSAFKNFLCEEVSKEKLKTKEYFFSISRPLLYVFLQFSSFVKKGVDCYFDLEK